TAASGNTTQCPGRGTLSGAPRRACCATCITWCGSGSRQKADAAARGQRPGWSVALLRGFAFFENAAVQGVAPGIDGARLQRRHHPAPRFMAVRAVIEAAVLDVWRELRKAAQDVGAGQMLQAESLEAGRIDQITAGRRQVIQAGAGGGVPPHVERGGV